MPVKLSHICVNTGWSKQRIEKWFSDGSFRLIDQKEQPVDDPERGLARVWTQHDLMRLMCSMFLREMGAAPDALLAIGALHGFKHEDAYLVVTVHDRDFVKINSPADLIEPHPAWKEFRRRQGTASRHRAWCVMARQICEHTHGQSVIGAHVLALAKIEAESERIMKRAERMANRK